MTAPLTIEAGAMKVLWFKRPNDRGSIARWPSE